MKTDVIRVALESVKKNIPNNTRM